MTQGAKEQIIYTWTLAGKLHKLLDQKAVDYMETTADDFMKLFEKYQNVVITVGEFIEQCINEQDWEDIIRALEEYCEDIYFLSQSITNIQSYYAKSEILFNKHQQILQILESLAVKKLALFLPYKFSMWDSLESIYLAANEDPEWDAVVMPIPYTEQEQQKQVKIQKYEGEEYKQISIVSYNKYNISVQKPDVIYIHNPYDGYNLVTSVGQEYYTNELKKHCQKIVYVPYFFTGKAFPEMHLDIPTYQDMDYIVLPSEEAKEQMKKYVKESKLLALGSPKVDKMLNMNRIKAIPEEWKDRIKGRKTVLYNVGLETVLKYGFQTILKMRYIFNYFKKQNDLVLWWRPHPLMKATLKSMRPELLGAYEEMEKAFILEKIGIYDTTADSNMAVAGTDAFLGDSSSMCALYGIMGKPVFLTETLTTEEPTEEERRKLWLGFPGYEPYIREFRTYPIVDEEENLFFYSAAQRLFGKISKDMEKVQVCAQLEDIYCKIQAFHTKDPKKMEIHFYPVEKDKPGKVYHVAEQTWTESNCFMGIPLAKYGVLTEYKNQWIIAPGQKPEFIYVNKNTGEKHIYCGYDEVLRPYCQMPEERLFGNGFLQIGNYVYLLAYRINKLLEFNLENKSWKYYDIGNGQDRFSSFGYDDVDFWFLAWDGSHIVKWNKETGKVQTYSDMPKGFSGLDSGLANADTPAFAGMIYDIKNKAFIIFPYIANMILKFNIGTEEISQWKLDLPYEEGQRKSSLYCMSNNYGACLWYDDDHLLMQTTYDGSILLVNLKTAAVERKQSLLSQEDYEKYRVPVECQAVLPLHGNFYFFKENAFSCTLKDMMDCFASGADMQEERQRLTCTEGIANADGSCGKKVHEFITNEFN